MSEQLGFALVLLVAIASVASVLLLSSVSPTAQVIAGQATVTVPSETTCMHVICPGHAQAYPLLDARGYVLYREEGIPVCVCPPR